MRGAGTVQQRDLLWASAVGLEPHRLAASLGPRDKGRASCPGLPLAPPCPPRRSVSGLSLVSRALSVRQPPSKLGHGVGVRWQPGREQQDAGQRGDSWVAQEAEHRLEAGASDTERSRLWCRGLVVDKGGSWRWAARRKRSYRGLAQRGVWVQEGGRASEQGAEARRVVAGSVAPSAVSQAERRDLGQE